MCASLTQMRHIALAVLISAVASPALADTGQVTRAAQTAFQTGQFQQAATLAEKAGNADALALAARALLAKGMCGESQPPAALLAEAEQLAREAVALDPDHVEGRLQLAIALSLKARPMSTREALRSGLGGASRELAESVLSDDPTNAYAHGLMAVWHVEVVRRGGPLGSAMMGASVRKGLGHYRQAVRLKPGDASMHWQMARALAALDARKYRAEIDAALSEALAAPAGDALERVMAERAAYLAAALDRQTPREVQALAERML